MPDEAPRDDDLTTGGKLGRAAGRLVRRARATDVQRMAQSASSAAGPAFEQAAAFVRAHESELRQAGRTGARATVARALPPAVSPIAARLVDELFEPARRDDPPPATPDG